MRDTLSALCGSFIENRDIIKSAFGLESAYLYPVCAAVFTDKRQRADAARLKYCWTVLKEQTGVFSNFRGIVKLVTLSMMAVDSDPEGKLRRALQVYEILKERFFSSQYLPVASMIFADLVQTDRYEEISARTRRIYDLMKREHPFLTSGEDSVFAALLALSDRTEEQIVRETEACYMLLKPEFFSGNAVQSLSHVLALGGGSAEMKCRRTVELFHGLKDSGCRYGTSHELATLGVLAMLLADQQRVITDIVEVDGFLSTQKGYGFFGVGSRQRLMHAGMLVASDYIGQDSTAMQSAAVGATISLIAAEQAAMCAAVAAAAAASSAGSSG